MSNSSTFQSLEQFNISCQNPWISLVDKCCGSLSWYQVLKPLSLQECCHLWRFGRTAGRLNLRHRISVCNIVRVGVCIWRFPLQALGTACFFLVTFHLTELRMTCLKASQCRFLAPMFDSYEGVRLSLPAQFLALATVWHVCHGRIWPIVFSAEDCQQNCDLQ